MACRRAAHSCFLGCIYAAPSQPRRGVRSEPAGAKARDLERRLTARIAELDREEHLQPSPPVAAAAALIIPQGLLDRLAGRREKPAGHYAKDTREVDERAMAAVMAAERSQHRDPERMAHNNP